jgi:hypothetical protein
VESFQSKENDGSASNLSSYVGSAKIKKHHDSTTSSSFTVNIIGSTGEVSIAMTGGKTSSLKSGRHYYDVRLVSPSGSVSRLVEGMAIVESAITTG